MVRKRRNANTEQRIQTAAMPSPIAQPSEPLAPAILKPSVFERVTAVPLFFLTTVPMVLVIIAVGYQLWSVSHDEELAASWMTVIIIPVEIAILPVLFYLGWYFQAVAKNRYLDMGKALGGYFRVYCQSLYAALAAITLVLAVIGILGSAFVDSSLIMICWVGTAFVGIGLVSWFFQNTTRQADPEKTEPISLKPTGIAFVLFSGVWLYTCVAAIVQDDWTQFQGGLVLLLLFLVPGLFAIRLSGRRNQDKSKGFGPRSDSIDHD